MNSLTSFIDLLLICHTFQNEITTRVSSVLERTPFQFKEIKTRESLAAIRAQRKAAAADSVAVASEVILNKEDQVKSDPTIQLTSCEDPLDMDLNPGPQENLYELAKTLQVSLENERDLILLGGGGGGAGGLSASNSQDLLSTASPIFGYNTFEMVDDHLNSISSPDNDEEDYGLDQSLTEDFRHGITNINYDFDVCSDQSAENSVAEGGKGDLLTSKMLIEESPKDELLPSPLVPMVTGAKASVDPHEARRRPHEQDPENLFIHK